MAKSNNNTVSVSRIEKVVAFVRDFNARENRGCPVGAIEYIGGFSKAEIKAAKASGMLESGKGSEGGFFPAGAKPVAKGPQTKATVKNQMAAFITSLLERNLLSDSDSTHAGDLLAAYEAQNAKRRKSDD